jgi:hypothetical protein
MLDTAVAEVVKDPIGRAAIPVRNTEEVLHVTDLEIGYAPATKLPSRA